MDIADNKHINFLKGENVKTRFVKVAGIAFGILWAAHSASIAQSQGNVYGKIYADWYDNQSNIHTLDATTARSGFDLTRAYFGYDYKIDSNFTGDVLLDVALLNLPLSLNLMLPNR